MFFLRPIDVDSSFNSVGAGSQTMGMGVLVCPPLFWPAIDQSESWAAIYRLAYEQLLSAFAPSNFQARFSRR